MHNPDEVYVDHITRLGESHEVVATEDIRSQHGAKLVAQGARIDRNAYERLIRHKLLRPVDRSIRIEDSVTVGTLMKEARRLVESNHQTGLLLGMLRDPEAPVRAIGRAHLEPAFAVKLTVARERLPAVFLHSIKVALASSILAQAMDMNGEDVATLAMAGLFHDLGELHIDPAIFEPGRMLAPEDWRQLCAHPAIAYAMLTEFPAYHPRVSRPVLEHHERADGSGYPKALEADGLSLPGRVLALGELVTGVCERKGCEHMGMLLRFQADRYGGDLVQQVAAVLHHAPRACHTKPPLDKARLGLLAATLEECLAAWPAAVATDAAATLVAARLDSLRRSCARTGLPTRNHSQVFGILDDRSPELGEMEVLLREALYYLRDIGHELRRRHPAIIQSSGQAAEWMRSTDQIVSAALAQAATAEPVLATA